MAKKNEGMDEFKKKYKKDVVPIENMIRSNVQVLRTGSIRLDLRLRGGFRAGSISELHGREGSGKSTIALSTASQVLKNGGRVLYLDLEYSLDAGTDYGDAGKTKSWLETLGIDLKDENFVIARPITGEEIYDMIEEVIRNELFDLIVLDSLAAVQTRVEVESGAERSFGGTAKLNSIGLRRILAAFGHQKTQKTHVMLINQIRDNVNATYGPKTTTSGGHAVRHYARTRLHISNRRHEQTETTLVTVRVIKNAFSPPYEESRLFIHPKYGVDVIMEIIKYGEKAGFVEKKGSWFTLFKDTGEVEAKVQGSAALRQILADSPKYTTSLKEQMWTEGLKSLLSEESNEDDFQE